MKLTLHPGSAIAGAVFIAVPFVLMSAQAEIAWPRQVPIPVSVQEMPDPHDMVVIRQEEGPYTVPEGKLFVLTSLGAQKNSTPTLSLDGVLEFKSSQSHSPLPTGFTASAAQVIVVESHDLENHARAWGYLVDE